MWAIETKNLTKEFNGLKVVDNISFKVKKGEIFGLLGPNGAGKTTIIKILTTLLSPTQGEAKVWGYNISDQRNEIRNSIGIVFQEPALDNRLTGFENLDFHARLYSLDKRTRQKRIKELLNLVGLKDQANDLVMNYSGGMLDEPTLGLDPQTRRRIWDYILELNKKDKITIILTTHYMEEADYLCHRVGIIDFGEIVALDTSQNLKNEIKSVDLKEPSLEDVFLHFTGKTIREREVGRSEKNRMIAKRFKRR